MICVSCEKVKVEPESDDPDICLGCQKKIDQIVADPMYFARANGMIIDALYPNDHSSEYVQEKRQQAVMLGFLNIFYPDMSMQRRMELTIPHLYPHLYK